MGIVPRRASVTRFGHVRHPASRTSVSMGRRVLGDSDAGVQEDVLHGVHQCGTLVDGTLERLAAQDESLATGTLVDHRSAHGTREVVITLGLSTGINETNTSGVT